MLTEIYTDLLHTGMTKIKTRNKIRLGAFERRILRKIYGSVKKKDTWRVRYNRELYALYQELEVVATLKKNTLAMAWTRNENGRGWND